GSDAQEGFLSFEAGELTCSGCPRRPKRGAEVSREMVRIMLQLRDVHPRELSQWNVDSGLLRHVRELMLDYLEYHLGRSVNSRRFIDILA
ncbi:MAG: DNA repair protein RecO C-terminal domain-containing protein, partial [Bacillota bacterium]